MIETALRESAEPLTRATAGPDDDQEVARFKRQAQRVRPGAEGPLLDQLAAALQAAPRGRQRAAVADREYQLLWILLPLARRAGALSRFRNQLDRAIALSRERHDEMLALAGLRADLEEQDGELHRAEQTVRWSLERARDLDAAKKATLLLKLARLLARQRRSGAAEELLADVLPILREANLPALTARAHFQLGNLALHDHRLAEAEAAHREALEMRRELGDARGVCASTSALGAVCLAAGDYPQALTWYRASEAEARRHDEEGELAWALLGLGRALLRLGDYAAAATRLRAAQAIRTRAGDEEGRARVGLAVAENELLLGRLDNALASAQQAAFQLDLVGTADGRGDAEQLLGRIHLAQRHDRESRQHLDAALALHTEAGDETAVAFDRSWQLQTMLAWPVAEEIEPMVAQITRFLDTHAYPDLGEHLDLRVYQALAALAAEGLVDGRVQGRLRYLERAHEQLLRKTSYLDAPLRHRFLFQVTDHDAILRAASAHGLHAPAAG